MTEKDIYIRESETVKDAYKKLDRSAKKVLLVIDGGKRLIGSITDGDIRRYILKGKSLDNDIKEVYNKKPIFIREEDNSPEAVKALLAVNHIEVLPVLDNENRVVNYITWNELFAVGSPASRRPTKKTDLPVVIMAGGKGSRLEPFNRILPKPLIPVNDKPIVEIIINEFTAQGAKKFYITLNYKGDMVKLYMDSVEKDYEVEYVTEPGYLGTAGSLKLVAGRIAEDFIVSNCDVMVKADFAEVANFHKEKKAALTILSSIQHYKIPYGVINFKDGGDIIDIVEKPEYTFPINTGVCLMNRQALDFIPENKSFDMTDLIGALIKAKKRVVTYPVNESAYIDIGQWEEYKKSLEKLKFFV